MKRYIFKSIIPALFVLMMAGCAQWGGDNPLGITGGSEVGYGQSSDLNLPYSSNPGIDPDLIGTWRYDLYQGRYELLIFEESGDFAAESYSENQMYYRTTGTYSVSGNTLNLTYMGATYPWIYSISQNRLTIDSGQLQRTYHR
jgi:hypothetical protein